MPPTKETSIQSIAADDEDASSFEFKEEHLSGLFPFHILVDEDFTIVNVGEGLPKILKKAAHDIQGTHIGDIVQITR